MNMKQRLIAILLCVATCIAFIPANRAEAQVLSGNTSKVDYDNTSTSKYTIEIDLVNQIITVYQGGIGGRIVLQSLCTTGNAENPTGAGTYKLGHLKERFGYFVAFGQYAQYWTQVVRGIYIHSVMYDSMKLSSMSRSAYNNLGKAKSHGCIRVLPHVAQWIYYNCPPGTTCKIDRKKAADPALVKKLKKEIPSYSDYQQPADMKPYPVEVPAVAKFDNVPLRTGFSNSRDKTVATVNKGAKMVLLQIGPDWCKVRLENGKLGYVKTEYLLFYPDRKVVSTETYTATKKTYVYESMSTGAKRLATIPEDGEATVVSNPKKGWWYGSYNGVTGYMRTKYVVKETTVVYPSLTGGSTGGFSSSGGSSSGLGGSSSSSGLSGGSSSSSSSGLGGSSSSGSLGGSSSSSSLSGGSKPSGGLSSGNVSAPSVSGGTRIRTDISANMRASGSTSAKVVTVLSGGTAVEILSVSESGWYRCSANGYTGYIHKSCLEMN